MIKFLINRTNKACINLFLRYEFLRIFVSMLFARVLRFSRHQFECLKKIRRKVQVLLIFFNFNDFSIKYMDGNLFPTYITYFVIYRSFWHKFDDF